MSDAPPPHQAPPGSRPAADPGPHRPVEHGELIVPGGAAAERDADREQEREFVSEPAKVMRVGSMIKQLLDEVRSATLDEASRERLKAIYERSIDELGSALSPDLRAELERLALPFGDGSPPSEVELRVAQAQVVGWLEGLFHGIQATLFAQQMAARQQLENMRAQLTQGGARAPEERPGTYL